MSGIRIQTIQRQHPKCKDKAVEKVDFKKHSDVRAEKERYSLLARGRGEFQETRFDHPYQKGGQVTGLERD